MQSIDDDKTVAEDSFDEFVKAMGIDSESRLNQTLSVPMNRGEFLVLLETFEQITPILNHKESIHKFWATQEESFPILYELAMIVNAIPPTQTTVERAFSIMSFVFNCKKSNMSDRTLETILMIRLNKDLLEPILQSDLKISTSKNDC